MNSHPYEKNMHYELQILTQLIVNPFCNSHLCKRVPFLTTAIGSPVSFQCQWGFQHFTKVRPHSAVIEHFLSIFCSY